jgi:hypothetical protein
VVGGYATSPMPRSHLHRGDDPRTPRCGLRPAWFHNHPVSCPRASLLRREVERQILECRFADRVPAVTEVVGAMKVSQRAFGPTQSVSVGRSDERAWTPPRHRGRPLPDNLDHRAPAGRHRPGNLHHRPAIR